jgi:hypothetical protein
MTTLTSINSNSTMSDENRRSTIASNVKRHDTLSGGTSMRRGSNEVKELK